MHKIYLHMQEFVEVQLFYKLYNKNIIYISLNKTVNLMHRYVGAGYNCTQLKSGLAA